MMLVTNTLNREGKILSICYNILFIPDFWCLSQASSLCGTWRPGGLAVVLLVCSLAEEKQITGQICS